jgi:hypothetical protein
MVIPASWCLAVDQVGVVALDPVDQVGVVALDPVVVLTSHPGSESGPVSPARYDC